MDNLYEIVFGVYWFVSGAITAVWFFRDETRHQVEIRLGDLKLPAAVFAFGFIILWILLYRLLLSCNGPVLWRRKARP